MFGYPISQSVPHIYLSALPFSPSEPSLLRQWKRQYPNTLLVKAGKLEQWPLILHVFHGHDKEVQSVAFSPDGTRIISGSGDNTIQLWDVASGTAIGEPLKKHSGRVSSVAFSPNGTCIVSGSIDRTIQLWDATSGTAIGKPLQGHSEKVLSVAFSPDGSRIVSGSADTTIRLWDAASGIAIGSLPQGHSGEVSSIAFFPDGAHIVSCSKDDTIRLWDAALSTTIGDISPTGTLLVTSTASVASCTNGVSGSEDPANQLCHTPVISGFTPFHNSHSSASPPNAHGARTLSPRSHFTALSMFSIHSPLNIDGWLTSPDGELLFWVPFGNRLGLLRPGTLNVFGTAETRIDFERSAHGAEWTHCRLL